MISERTPLPLSLVPSLIIGAVSLAGMGAVAQYRISDTAERMQELTKAQAQAQVDAYGRERRIQRLEDAFGEVKDALKEIKQDVKELRRRERSQ